MPITLSKRSFQQADEHGPKRRDSPKPITGCLEGHVVVSTKGATSIFTGGFAQCLGVMVATPDNQAGLVAHVKQMGKKEGSDEAYMTAFCEAIVHYATQALNAQKLYVALYKGDGQGCAWSLGLKDNPKVLNVLDLRTISHSPTGGADLVFDTAKKKLYIPSGLNPVQLEAVGERTEKNVEVGELANALAKRPMKVFHTE